MPLKYANSSERKASSSARCLMVVGTVRMAFDIVENLHDVFLVWKRTAIDMLLWKSILGSLCAGHCSHWTHASGAWNYLRDSSVRSTATIWLRRRPTSKRPIRLNWFKMPLGWMAAVYPKRCDLPRVDPFRWWFVFRMNLNAFLASFQNTSPTPPAQALWAAVFDFDHRAANSEADRMTSVSYDFSYDSPYDFRGYAQQTPGNAELWLWPLTDCPIETQIKKFSPATYCDFEVA